MKNLFLLLSLLGSFLVSGAQSLPDFSSIKLASDADYNAAANDAALKASLYILSTPNDAGNVSRAKAQQYLMEWAQGSPDYSIYIDPAISKLTGGHPELLLVTIAAMTAYMLQNKSMKDDVNNVNLNAVKNLLEYVQNPAYKVQPEADLAKAIEANKKGHLKEYVDGLNKQ